MTPPDAPALPATPERPRVPHAVYEGLQITERARWTTEAIRAWWAWCVRRTDPASVAGVEGLPVLWLRTPEMVALVDASRHLDMVVHVLKGKAELTRRWNHYCYEVLTPQLLLESLEGCVAAGTLSREEVSRLQDESLMHVTAQGRWKRPNPRASTPIKE